MSLIKIILGNKVFKNFSYLSTGSILSQLISLLTVIKITRILAPEDYGTYTFLIVQGTLILTVGDLGLRNIVVRRIARDPLETTNLTINGAILRSLGILFLALPYWVYNSQLGSLNTTYVVLIFIYAIIMCLSRLLETAYLGNQKMLPPAIINLGFSLFWFIIIYVLPIQKINIFFLFTTFIIINILKTWAFYLLLKYHNLLLGKVKSFKTTAKGLLKESYPYFLLVLILLPFTHFSNNFLDLNSTKEELGYFNLADRLVGPISLVLDIALIALFPNLSSLWAKNKPQFIALINNGFIYYMLISLIFCFLFTLFIEDVFILLFTREYLPAVKVCQLQIWYLFLSSIDYFMGIILSAANRDKTILRLGIVRALMATPILYFGSTYGALGLSTAYVTSFTIFQIYLWFTFKRELSVRIKYENPIMFLSIALFVIALFIGPRLQIGYKILLAVLIVSFTAAFIHKTYKTVLK